MDCCEAFWRLRSAVWVLVWGFQRISLLGFMKWVLGNVQELREIVLSRASNSDVRGCGWSGLVLFWWKSFFGERDTYLQYNAPGAPNLAKRVKELLLNAGRKTVIHDFERGLDHGAWIPLSLMYPDADIPVCQLSIQLRRNGTYHYKMGRALAPLRSEGVLIIGSGSATHNFRDLYTNRPTPAPWALRFDEWLTKSLINGRFKDVNHIVGHPNPTHYYPLNVALGAAGEGAKVEQIHNSWSHATLSYSSYAFKSA